MSVTVLSGTKSGWHPIASSSDLVDRHVYQGQLFGYEFAVWRSDDGFVNIWENRCLHRGVRLSVGTNDGAELVCQYHGWRYANRTGGVTYIPAHPADANTHSSCARSYVAVERYGLIWTTLDSETSLADLEVLDVLDDGQAFPLRPIDLWVTSETTISHLERIEIGCPTLADSTKHSDLVLFVQPVDERRCVVRGVLSERPDDEAKIDVLRFYSAELGAVRDGIEKSAGVQAAPEPAAFKVHPAVEVSIGLSSATNRQAAVPVRVRRRWNTATDVVGFELEAVSGQLSTVKPGSHIDLHLPNALVRQYSVVNAPGELDAYTIGVKLDPTSTGGSSTLHGEVVVGDELLVSQPRNGFPLRRDAVHTLLIAGGIGLTPILAMAQALDHQGLPYELHHFVRSQNHIAFADRLEALGTNVTHHLALDPDETVTQLQRLISSYTDAKHLYVCGPAPMLTAARATASANEWPDHAVHFEYFANPTQQDQSSEFEIALARSAVTLPVRPGESILEVLKNAGISMASSCEQGVCGTCGVDLIEGEPDHQDVYLNDTEKRTGKRLMTCVSRAKSSRLVLDL